MWLDDLLKRSLDAIEFTKGKTNALLKKWSFTLTAAGEQTINLAGNFIYVIEATDGTANIDAQFSRKDGDIDKYNLVKGLGFTYPFDKLHISWGAQIGKTLTILIGNLAPELMGIIDNRSNITSDTLLQKIVDELQGAAAITGWNKIDIDSTTPEVVIAANTSRKGGVVQASPLNTGYIYIGVDNTVAATKAIVCLAPGQAWSFDDYRGAIWALATVDEEDVFFGEW